MDIHIKTGDADQALSVMREAARWLIGIGKPMWNPEELERSRLANPPDEFLVLYAGGESAAACLLSFADPFFWPDVPAGTSGFIHKLAVRRKFAGQGLANRLIRHAAGLCLEKGVRELRLDCDPHRPGLLSFYENAGFQLLEIKKMTTQRLGIIDLAMYKMDLSRPETRNGEPDKTLR